MNRLEGRAETVNIQAKHITGQHNTAYHGACHRKKHEQHQYRPEHTDGARINPRHPKVNKKVI